MNNIQQTAEGIALALDKPRRTGPDTFTACCPAHDDRSPSFTATQKGDRVLLHCFSGCSQREVIDALRQRGLWPEKKKRRTAKIHSLIDKVEMRAFIGAHEYNLKKGIPTTTKHQQLYSQYQRILYAPFTPGEVAEMDLFCRLYQSDVKAGRTPTLEEDRRFMAFSRAVCAMGVPYAY
jgi:CHC2 zinc finger